MAAQWLIGLLLMAGPSLAGKYMTYGREEPDRFERLENQLRNFPRETCCDELRSLQTEVNRIGQEQASRSSRLSRNEQDIRDLTADYRNLASTVEDVRRVQERSGKGEETLTGRMDRLHSMFWFLIGGVILAVLLKTPSTGRTVKRHLDNLKGGDDE